MASIPLRLPFPSQPVSTTIAARRWPDDGLRRVLLRLALCLPFLAIAALAASRGLRTPANLALESQGRRVRWGSSDLAWVADAYPPLAVAIASIVPGGAAMLGVVGALCAGGMLQLVGERLVRSATQWWIVAILLGGLAGTPVFWYIATGDLSGFVGLALFTTALAGLLDFVFSRRTTGGFVAGLCLGLAVLVDPAAIVYTASVALAVPLLAWRHFRNDRGAIRSTLAVTVFPSVAVACAWTFFEWRFTGVAFHRYPIAPQLLQFPTGMLAGLRQAAASVGDALVLTPLFVLSGALLARRNPVALLGYLLAPIDLVLTRWLGMSYPAGQSLVLLDVVAIVALAASATTGGRRPIGAHSIGAHDTVAVLAGWSRTTKTVLVATALVQAMLWCTLALRVGPQLTWLRGLRL